MERELLIILENTRRELGIPEEDYLKIMALAKMHAKRSKIKINDEMIYEIVLDAISSYDYSVDENDKKSYIDAIRYLIHGEKNKRSISDEELFNTIENYLDLIEGKSNNKSLEENVDRAMKSLGY